MFHFGIDNSAKMWNEKRFYAFSEMGVGPLRGREDCAVLQVAPARTTLQ
jgi:hypothetical protein